MRGATGKAQSPHSYAFRRRPSRLPRPRLLQLRRCRRSCSAWPLSSTRRRRALTLGTSPGPSRRCGPALTALQQPRQRTGALRPRTAWRWMMRRRSHGRARPSSPRVCGSSKLLKQRPTAPDCVSPMYRRRRRYTHMMPPDLNAASRLAAAGPSWAGDSGADFFKLKFPGPL